MNDALNKLTDTLIKQNQSLDFIAALDEARVMLKESTANDEQ